MARFWRANLRDFRQANGRDYLRKGVVKISAVVVNALQENSAA